MSIITHNLNAMNTQRYLGVSSKDKKKSTEKLSSGYRINRSADDAAGLTISEKMRWQIRGLNKASRNVQDGMSLIQTADGALGQIQDILQRMNELSTQAANDTNTEEDRSALQSEMLQLNAEINRISRTTEFNSRTILMAKPLVYIDTDDYSQVSMDDAFYGFGNGRTGPVYGKTIDFSNITSANKEKLIDKQFFVTCSENCSQIFSFLFTDEQTSRVDRSGMNLTVSIGINDPALTDGSSIAGKINDLVVGQQTDLTNYLTGLNPNWSNDYNDTIIGHANALNRDGGKLTFYSISKWPHPPYYPGMGLIYATGLIEEKQDLLLQVSDRPLVEIAVNLKTITTGTLGLGAPNVSSYESAGKTMDSVQTALSNLSDYRSYLGAMQNRLERTKSVVDNTSENTQNSESKLRDTEMAEESIKFSRAKILEQFGQSMLAQQNQKDSAILQLLG